MKYMDQTRVDMHYELPLNEIVYDFFDALKSRTKGYASYDYEMKDYDRSKLVKLDVLLERAMWSTRFPLLSTRIRRTIAPASIAGKAQGVYSAPAFRGAYTGGGVGGKIIARETVKALRKGCSCKVLRRRYYPKEKAA